MTANHQVKCGWLTMARMGARPGNCKTEKLQKWKWVWDCTNELLPVEHNWPHASATAVDWDVNTQYLMHPRDITKPKVNGNERSDERSEDWVRDAQDQNEQMVGVLKKTSQQKFTMDIQLGRTQDKVFKTQGKFKCIMDCQGVAQFTIKMTPPPPPTPSPKKRK